MLFEIDHDGAALDGFGRHVLHAKPMCITKSRKRIPLNIDGVISGILCDLGLDWRLARAFVFVPRAADIAARAVEEVVREHGWRVVATADEIEYDGPAPRPYPARHRQMRHSSHS